METILPVKPVHSPFVEPVQYRMRVQTFTHCPPEVTVRRVDFEPQNERHMQAYRRALPHTHSGQVIRLDESRARKPRDPGATPDPENVQRAHYRAKRRLKDSVKELAPTALLTLTSRNRLHDLDRAYKAWGRFLTLVRQADPEFAAVVVPELHASGLHWHLHAAVRSVLGHKVLRRCWHIALSWLDGVKVTKTLRGSEAPGNVDLAYGSRGGDPAQRAAKIAKYISKYLSKDLHSQIGRKSYAPTRNIDVQRAQRFYLAALTPDAARLEALRALGFPDYVALGMVWWCPDEKLSFVALREWPPDGSSE